MKVKRNVCMILIVMVLAISTAFAASVANSCTINAKNINVSLYGYIDFLEGKFTFQDKIWYHAQLSGSDMGLVYNARSGEYSVYIIPGTDDDRMAMIYLDESKNCIPSTEVKTGYGGKKGILEMKCADRPIYKLYTR